MIQIVKLIFILIVVFVYGYLLVNVFSDLEYEDGQWVASETTLEAIINVLGFVVGFLFCYCVNTF